MFQKKKIGYIILTIFTLLLIGISIYQSQFGKKVVLKDLPEIKQKKQLNVVTDFNIVTYYVSGDTITGFTHDLLQLLAKDLGVKLNVTVENSLNKSIEGLENGTYDIVARNIPINNTLKDSIAFTSPIIRNKLILVQRKSADNNEKPLIRNHLDLANKTIYVPYSSPVKLRLINLSHEIGDTIFIKEDPLYDTPQLVMKVASGEIDFAVCDASLANHLLSTNPEIDINTDIGFTHFEAWAVRKTSPILLDSLNNWIERIQSTNEFEKIYNQYLKK